jgi:hypothetical protein
MDIFQVKINKPKARKQKVMINDYSYASKTIHKAVNQRGREVIFFMQNVDNLISAY